MGVNAKCLIESQNAPNAQTTLYTSPAGGKGTIIDKFTGSNYDAAPQTLSVNLVPSGGAAGNSNLISKTISIAAGASYTFPELIGHILAPGSFISVIAGAATVMAVRASGRELT